MKMTTNSNHDEDCEALSLSDLPIEEKQEPDTQKDESKQQNDSFDFRSWGGSILREAEMCAADEVFLNGQMLPFRFSVSSDNGFTGFRSDSSRNPSRNLSRSESMDRGSVPFASFSSRSSSSRSSSTTTTSSKPPRKPGKSQFFHYTHPSPKPQIVHQKVAGFRHRRSTGWDFFRVGLVRAPGIELQELKGRNNGGLRKVEKKGGIFGDCSCSVETIEKNIMVRQNSNNSCKNNGGRERVKAEREEVEKKKMTQKQEKKQLISRHRTFEWLKDLSHPTLSP